jgi:hypothetical protein
LRCRGFFQHIHGQGAQHMGSGHPTLVAQRPGVCRGRLAATTKFEVKRHGVSSHRNDCTAISSGGYSASHFAGATVCVSSRCGVSASCHPQDRRELPLTTTVRWSTQEARRLVNLLPDVAAEDCRQAGFALWDATIRGRGRAIAYSLGVPEQASRKQRSVGQLATLRGKTKVFLPLAWIPKARHSLRRE